MKIKLTSASQLKTHLKSLRKTKGWSQHMLAERLGLSQSRIVQIEKNPELVSFDQLMHLFNILGASLMLEKEDLSLTGADSNLSSKHNSNDKPKVKW